MTNQLSQQHQQEQLLNTSDLLTMGDFYQQLSLNTNNCSGQQPKSRLNSKSSSNDLSNEYLFNSISSPSKSSTIEVSSPESLKTQGQISTNNLRQRLNAPNFTSFKSDQDESQITKLFVGNLPTSTTLPELLAVFKKYGPVNEKLSVVKDQNYAFIHFYNRKDAQIALQEVNDSLFKDRYIRVQFSTSQGYTFNNKNKFTDKKRFNNSESKSAQQSMSHSISHSSLLTQQYQHQQPHHHQSLNQNRNFRPIVNKSYQQATNVGPNPQLNQTINQRFQEYQQTQLMHLLYLAQLQQQQQQQQQLQQSQQSQQFKFTRSNTIDNFSFHNNSDFSMPSTSNTQSTNNFLFSNAINSQPVNQQDNINNHLQNGIIRSNTMFSFPNSLNFNR